MKLVIYMMDKVIDLLKNNICIPKILLSNYKDLKINEKELIVLIYMLNEKDNLFNPGKISEELNLKLPEVLEIIEKLNGADLITISTEKNNGVLEEVIDLSNLYKKMAYLVINKEQVEEVDESKKTNIYDNFEREFGRTLSPIEYELISGWLENEFTEEIILCALKEAVFNGVSNLRYIDKILYEWKKKGINTQEAVLKDKENFKKNNTKKTEMFDYDWLNEE
ncbi:MAG: DnaD domain protein [Lactobacillales bacterium]|nr:DnaD domain protein [Lactobacillales bacterium]